MICLEYLLLLNDPLNKFIMFIIVFLSKTERERERERESKRGDRCVCELAHLHLRVTTNNEDLSLVI